MSIAPPKTEAELQRRALLLAGRSLGEIAKSNHRPVPAQPNRAKGWAGTLIEDLLGATAGNRPVPDFELLGVEMKTLPVDALGRPRESTYVCTAPLNGGLEDRWEDSRVKHKLGRVIWVPLVGTGAVVDRIVGTPLIWSPSPEEESVLRADWEALTDIIARGEVWNLNARHGTALQLRPKAANAKQMVWITNEDGEPARTQPRGFYLRASFTRGLVERHYRMG